jgi:lysophospholipase L1-like esterase
MDTHIFIFGDSVLLGCFDIAGGWASRLSNFAMERYVSGQGGEILTYNLSISGDQSQDIVARFEAELNPRLSEGGGKCHHFCNWR